MIRLDLIIILNKINSSNKLKREKLKKNKSKKNLENERKRVKEYIANKLKVEKNLV